MRYVITGASGHIGNNLVRYINEVEPNAEIIALNRRHITKELNGANVTQVVGDLNDIDFLSNNINNKDVVIHLACLIDLTNKKKDEMYKTNYLLTKNICDICLKKNVKKFIYVGSVDAIYREKTIDEIGEPQDYYPDKMIEMYAKTKAMASKYVLYTIKDIINFNCAIVLPSAVIGINDYKPSAIGKVILDSINGKKEFGMKGGYNFVDVIDVCRVIYKLAGNDKTGQFIVSGHDVSVKEVYGYINKFMGFKKKPIIIPTCIIWLCVPFVKVLNPVTIKALQDNHYYNNSKIIKELNIVPTDISTTFENTIKWFVNNKTKFI